jgi:hypothetical protein
MKPGTFLRTALAAAIAACAFALPVIGGATPAEAGSSYAERKYLSTRDRGDGGIAGFRQRQNQYHRQRVYRHEGRRHHKRYRHRYGNYSHFHNGWYYAYPWWAGAVIVAPSYSSDDRHVAWCYNRYRSYNEDRDAFKGYDGRWHRCISPYS